MSKMKAHAYEFASIVDREIEALSNDAFHLRPKPSKRLREEKYPLSRLGLHFKQPGLAVEVEWFEDSGPVDGFIRISGFRERAFAVQCTYAGYGRADKLRAELLVSQGFAPGAGLIQRQKRHGPIVATMQGVDIAEHIGRIATAVLERFRDKAGKHYAPGTVLLIAFDEAKLYGRQDWEQMLSKIEGEVVTSENAFAEVYLFNGQTNELRRAA